MAVYLDEGHVRQAVAGSLESTMTVPQAAWSLEFVEESVLAELTLADAVSSTGTSTAVLPAGTESASMTANTSSSSTSSTTSSSDTSAATEGRAGGSQLQVRLAPGMLELIEQFQQATAVDPSASSSAESAHVTSKAADKRSNSRSKKHITSQAAHGDGISIGPAALEAGAQQLQGMFGQLLQENYQEVEDADVIAFGVKLLQELTQLVEAAAAAQQPDVEGLCQLCEREMPLTKHHLIPRDVHKDFKNRGFGFHELQAGLMVCRPCHSAIHRAVPDNKELALHYRTLSDLQQHKDIASFASWARRQRPTHKVDVQSAHFRYRR